LSLSTGGAEPIAKNAAAMTAMSLNWNRLRIQYESCPLTSGSLGTLFAMSPGPAPSQVSLEKIAMPQNRNDHIDNHHADHNRGPQNDLKDLQDRQEREEQSRQDQARRDPDPQHRKEQDRNPQDRRG
jgi:hypothetical protein